MTRITLSLVPSCRRPQTPRVVMGGTSVKPISGLRSNQLRTVGLPRQSHSYGKPSNATVDAFTTHDYARWLKEPQNRPSRFSDLGGNMLTHLVGQIGNASGQFGFLCTNDRF